MKRLFLVLALAAALSACAMAPLSTSGPRLPDPPDSASGTGSDSTGAGARFPAPPGAGEPAAPVSSATRALLTQSQSEREAGDLGGAAATVERALTISPDEAVLWMELAEIRMAQGDFALAEEMARKALTLTDPNSVVAERARRLIGR